MTFVDVEGDLQKVEHDSPVDLSLLSLRCTVPLRRCKSNLVIKVQLWAHVCRDPIDLNTPAWYKSGKVTRSQYVALITTVLLI